MNNVEPDEKTARTIQQNQAYTDHQACFIPKDCRKKEPHCIICSIEESVWRKVIEKNNRKGRSYLRRTKFLAMCSNAVFQIIAHTCPPATTKMSSLPQFLRMNCFKIAQSDVRKVLFCCVREGWTQIFQNKTYSPNSKGFVELIQR